MQGRESYQWKKKVHIDNNVHTLLVPYEDRKGEWMNYAIDRAHFRKGVQQTNNFFLPILNKVIKGQLNLDKKNVYFSETFRL